MLSTTGKMLFVAALSMHGLRCVAGGSLRGGQQTDAIARSEIPESEQTQIHEIPLQEEKAVPRKVLKEPAWSHPSRLPERQEANKQLTGSGKAAVKHRYKKQISKTLKGFKYEAQKKATTTTVAPEELHLKSQQLEPIGKESEKLEYHEEEDEHHEEEQLEQESSDDPSSWLTAGAEAEWNPMVAKKAKHLLKERDWIEVTIVDKENDNGVITYGIQRGTLRTRVRQEQLRKPVRAQQLAEDRKREQSFWEKHKARNKPAENKEHLEDVMVPLKAKTGRTCKGNPARLNSKYVNADGDQIDDGLDGDLVDAEGCRELCEQDVKCKFASYGLHHFPEDTKPSMSCLSFESCDETTGKGYRTWQKVRLDSEKAHKAKHSERREDEYMAKIREAEEISLQRLEAEEEEAKHRAAENEAEKEEELKNSQVKKEEEFKNFFAHRHGLGGTGHAHPGKDEQWTYAGHFFWRHLLELGALVIIAGMWKTRTRDRKGRKELQGDKKAEESNKTWMKHQSSLILTVLKKLFSPPKMASDVELRDAAAAIALPKNSEKASQRSDEDKKSQVRSSQTSRPTPSGNSVDGNAPVNKAALRAAFRMAGNTRTSSFR